MGTSFPKPELDETPAAWMRRCNLGYYVDPFLSNLAGWTERNPQIPAYPREGTFDVGYLGSAHRTIKGRLRKAMQTQNTTNWVKVLPVVLAELRMTRTDILGGLSPYEIVMGRPFPVPWRQKTALGGTADLDVRRSEYTAGLLTVLNEYWERVNQTITDPPKVPTHSFKPGDKILVKKFERKGFSDPIFSEPTTVLAVTRTGVLTDLFPQCLMDRVYTLAAAVRPPPPVYQLLIAHTNKVYMSAHTPE
ncbi:hypothetical protein MHYP_G00088620 [Metynnis hypsauchen]